MSGRGTGPDYPPEDPSCEDLRFNSTLTDIDPGLVARVIVGQTLSVGLLDDRYPIAYVDGQRLGSIVSRSTRVLAECLRQGEPFVCDVLKVDGGWVDVLVRHA